MARTFEDPIPIESTYRDLLKVAVEKAGGQYAVAAMAKINQSTVSRALEGRATYTTLRKLSAVLPGIPSPIVAVRDEKHEHWCRLGAELAGSKPSVFALLLRAAEEAAEAVPRMEPDAALNRLKSVVSDPIPSKRSRR